jgi:hypothetical protein
MPTATSPLLAPSSSACRSETYVSNSPRLEAQRPDGRARRVRFPDGRPAEWTSSSHSGSGLPAGRRIGGSRASTGCMLSPYLQRLTACETREPPIDYQANQAPTVLVGAGECCRGPPAAQGKFERHLPSTPRSGPGRVGRGGIFQPLKLDSCRASSIGAKSTRPPLRSSSSHYGKSREQSFVPSVTAAERRNSLSTYGVPPVPRPAGGVITGPRLKIVTG